MSDVKVMTYNDYHPCSEGDIVFSSVCLRVYLSVCLSVTLCLSVNKITPEPLEISSQNFQGIILWFKG